MQKILNFEKSCQSTERDRLGTWQETLSFIKASVRFFLMWPYTIPTEITAAISQAWTPWL